LGCFGLWREGGRKKGREESTAIRAALGVAPGAAREDDGGLRVRAKPCGGNRDWAGGGFGARAVMRRRRGGVPLSFFFFFFFAASL
jgi:hypothetical protein